MQLVGRAGVVLEVAGQRRGVGTTLLQRLAGRAGLESREFVVMVQHRGGELQQQSSALRRGHSPPVAIEGFTH